MSNMISVMRTGHLYKADMADELLKDARVPHHLREESASGMRVAMPAAPSMGPGVWWAVLVPEERAEEARLVLSELPFEITTTPGVWDSQPGGASGPFGVWYRVLAGLVLAYIFVNMITMFMRAL